MRANAELLCCIGNYRACNVARRALLVHERILVPVERDSVADQNCNHCNQKRSEHFCVSCQHKVEVLPSSRRNGVALVFYECLTMSVIPMGGCLSEVKSTGNGMVFVSHGLHALFNPLHAGFYSDRR